MARLELVGLDRLVRRYVGTLVALQGENGSMYGDDVRSLRDNYRLTHQLVTALLACGFPSCTPQLERAKQSFLETQPEDTRFGAMHVEKLGALIELGDIDDPYVSLALDELISTQNEEGYFAFPDLENYTFSTLWAVRILLDSPAPARFSAQVEKALRLVASNPRFLWHNRDLSLALYLLCRWEIKDLLDQKNEILSRLLSSQQEGLWDIDDSVKPLIDEIKSRGLVRSLLADVGIASRVRHTIVSTGYIIQNLMPLYDKDPDVRQASDNAVNALWEICSRSSEAIDNVFERTYDQVMVLSRVLVALAEYSKADFGQMILPLLLQDTIHYEKEHTASAGSRQKKRLVKVIKEWIEIEWDAADLEQLSGGYSGAAVIRVKPRISLPLGDGAVQQSMPLPGVHSLIIKHGSKKDLDKERTNYELIPSRRRHMFARIPKPSYTEVESDESFVEYLVIQDLLGYTTFEERFLAFRSTLRGRLTKELCDFLTDLYEFETVPIPGRSLTRELYVNEILQSANDVFTFLERQEVLPGESSRFFDILQRIIQYVQFLDNFRPTMMHGDLHTRNIMIYARSDLSLPPSFKLIDLDRFLPRGDFAYDIGELLVDFRERFRGKIESDPTFGSFIEIMNRRFLKWAEERGDETYLLRLMLAQTRSLFKTARIHMREGERFLVEGPIRSRKANLSVEETARLTREAMDTLETCLASLSAPQKQSQRPVNPE